jgi:hypothetical protein
MTGDYAFRARIDAPFSSALPRVKEALKAEGSEFLPKLT